MMIDLRSDTVTQPPAAMQAAMRRATLGDDARDGDPTVRELEGLAAARTGKDAAVLVPSGTMANLVSLLAHADRGGELLCEDRCHTLHFEMGGVSNLAGTFPRGLPGRRGVVDLDALRANIRPRLTVNKPGTALVWMETTHGASGGAVVPLAHMSAVTAIAHERNIPVHVDGARLFNAAAALGVTVAEVARHADSVSFCLSKGLSAPIGSLICGSRQFIERARSFRRMVGGNMRQAGIIAAAGIYALEHLAERLIDDHRTAQRLARGLRAIDASIVDPAQVESNIVRASVGASGRTGAEWSAQLKNEGVRVNPCSDSELRFVTHRHIGEADIDRMLEVFSGIWKRN
ncbi:MAG: aminotransferase class I/II-fold pyridoxal phosphate-dependent enzyme [Betaproteobacteria bacterium]|nr:aminotransferase class I/II-fold pyridoxal phosphate-dependent enzyme [Betaproteobacteria bacterium]